MTTTIGTRYSSALLEDNYDTIVIGSGLGGLTAAAVLARRGQRVLVLERHYTAGGFTHAYQRRGYEWDVGVHYIGAVDSPASPIRRVFDTITDGQLQWAPMDDVYDRVIVGEQSVDFVAGAANFRESLLASFPGAQVQIDGYLQAIRNGSGGLMSEFVPRAMAPAALGGALGRMPGRGSAFRRTTKEVLRPIISDPKLYGVLTAQWGDYGLPPARSAFGMHALVASHYLAGASYPVGGSLRIAATIVPGIERAGGRVLVDAGVAQILVSGGRAVGVELADGAQVRARRVISGVGVQSTFGRLLDPDVAAGLPIAQRAAALRPATGHLCLTIGLRGSDADLGLPRTNLWLFPGYDHDAAVARFAADPRADLPVNYISFPSAKDPTSQQRHPGRVTIEAITMAPYEWFAPWADKPWRKRGADYEEFKEQFAQRMLAQVRQQVPAVADRIDYYELSTPLSTQTFNGYARGEVYGLEHSPERFAARWLSARTPVPGLYLTGQDTLTCGVASALLSGVLTAGAVLDPASQAAMVGDVFGLTPKAAVNIAVRKGRRALRRQPQS